MAMNCDVGVLAAQGAEFDGLLDPQKFQALKTYLLALILKAVSSGRQDFTDWCALAADLKQFDALPDYKRRSAYINMLVQTAIEAGVTDEQSSEAAIREALSCWCCGVSPQTLQSMEIFLLCQLFQSQGG